ncbi:unnamed protein product [Dicrocoelium dendriticum]|nr:unnamed protein product [Dicrocoelium dendriticum]
MCVSLSSRFTDVGSGQCFIAYPGKIGFCDGHKKCHDEGVKRGLNMFLVGRYPTLLRPHFLNYSTIHTGMHDLLFPFCWLKVGWQTNDPGHYSRVTDSIVFMRGEPRFGDGVVIVFTPQGFKTEVQDSTLRTLNSG